MKKIVVIGAGAFGTAMALSGVRAGASVVLVTRREEMARELNTARENHQYLPGIPLPNTLAVTNSLASLKEADLVLLAAPAQTTPESAQALKDHLNPETPLVLCAKGIHRYRQSLLAPLVREILPNPLAVLSGPSFADEVAKGLPAAVMVAADDLALAQDISQTLRHSRLRCYGTDDMVGVQVGGSLKNVIAIASGIVAGKDLGQNACAALLSRGLAEIMRIGVALGGDRETFMGLAGVGDLILTGSSLKSRNYSFGFELGQGKSAQEILEARQGVTEGFATTAAGWNIAQHHHLHAPITHAIYRLLHEGENLDLIIESILAKQSDTEF